MNKLLIITGAAGSIGRSLAPLLGQQGYRLALVFRQSDAESASVIDLCRQSAPDVCGYFVDMENADQIREFVGELVQRQGVPFGVIQLIGDVLYRELFPWHSDGWHHMIQSNVTTTMLLADATWEAMAGTGAGRFLLFGFSGVSTGRGYQQIAAYAAAKEALLSLMRSLMRRMAPLGITVNMISPGIIQPEYRALNPVEETMRHQIPMGRLGTADDLAHAVLWLLSPLSGYVTGQNIKISGGLHISASLF